MNKSDIVFIKSNKVPAKVLTITMLDEVEKMLTKTEKKVVEKKPEIPLKDKVLAIIKSVVTNPSNKLLSLNEAFSNFTCDVCQTSFDSADQKEIYVLKDYNIFTLCKTCYTNDDLLIEPNVDQNVECSCQYYPSLSGPCSPLSPSALFKKYKWYYWKNNEEKICESHYNQLISDKKTEKWKEIFKEVSTEFVLFQGEEKVFIKLDLGIIIKDIVSFVPSETSVSSLLSEPVLSYFHDALTKFYGPFHSFKNGWNYLSNVNNSFSAVKSILTEKEFTNLREWIPFVYLDNEDNEDDDEKEEEEEEDNEEKEEEENYGDKDNNEEITDDEIDKYYEKYILPFEEEEDTKKPSPDSLPDGFPEISPISREEYLGGYFFVNINENSPYYHKVAVGLVDTHKRLNIKISELDFDDLTSLIASDIDDIITEIFYKEFEERM